MQSYCSTFRQTNENMRLIQLFLLLLFAFTTHSSQADDSFEELIDLSHGDVVLDSNTSSPQDPANATTIAPANATTIAPANATTIASVNASTIAAITTTEPLNFTEIPITNKMVYPTDGPRGLVQNILVLRNQINQLTQELQAMINDLKPSSSPLLSQLADAQSRAEQMNSTISSLQQRLSNLTTIETQLQTNAMVMQSYYDCLSQSSCVTVQASSTTSTTPQPLTPCAGPPTPATDSVQYYNITTPIKNAQCSFGFGSAQGLILNFYNINITGTAFISVLNGTGSVIKTYNSSDQSPGQINGTGLNVKYSVDSTSTLTFDSSYKLDELKCDTPCDNGECVINDNIPTCACHTCYSLVEGTCAPQACTARQKSKSNCDSEKPCTLKPNENGSCDVNCTPKTPSFAKNHWLQNLF